MSVLVVTNLILVLLSSAIRRFSTHVASKPYLLPPVTDMSRAFSTAAQKLKSLSWSSRGTTQDVAWVKHYAENAVDLVPQLLDKVDSGTVQYILPLPGASQLTSD